MPTAKFKQRCAICKKNMVLMYSARQFPICTSCHMKRIDSPIEEAEFKKFFDLPKELYEQSSFLRSIKESYLRFHALTDKQKEVFKKVVEDLKKPKEPKESVPPA